jgi:hypothetical protein
MIISERMPNLRDARGVVDRSFSFTTYKGLPKYDIKETLEPQGNKARQQRLDILNDYRKLMLVYRLIHFKDEIPDIDIGIEGREKELSKPIIQLFYNTKAQNEVEATLQYFLNARSEKKEITLEPILHPIVTDLVSKNGTEISNAIIWEAFRNAIDGHYDGKKPYEYHTLEYGTIYNITISNILEHTFGGRTKHRAFGNTFIFDPEELARIGKAYNLTTKIQTKIIVTEENQGILFEDPEGSEGIRKGPTSSNGDRNAEKSDTTRDNDPSNNDEKGLNQGDRPFAEASYPSDPSNKNIEESSNSNSTTSQKIPDSIYRAYGDVWKCKNCKLRDDKWGMINHHCRNQLKPKSGGSK